MNDVSISTLDLHFIKVSKQWNAIEDLWAYLVIHWMTPYPPFNSSHKWHQSVCDKISHKFFILILVPCGLIFRKWFCFAFRTVFSIDQTDFFISFRRGSNNSIRNFYQQISNAWFCMDPRHRYHHRQRRRYRQHKFRQNYSYNN